MSKSKEGRTIEHYILNYWLLEQIERIWKDWLAVPKAAQSPPGKPFPRGTVSDKTLLKTPDPPGDVSKDL